MKFKERLDKFLELQNKNIPFEDISKELELSPSTLRGFLNKRGYKCESGKYILKEKTDREIEKRDKRNVTKKNKEITIKKSKKNTDSKVTDKKNNVDDKIKKVKKEVMNKSEGKGKKVNKKEKPKKDRKINITQDDLDKLCEVYDWYLEVKDNKSIKIKNVKSNNKDIKMEDANLNDLKSASIRVDKKVWEDFERLCSNSQYNKQEIITQALRDFMKQYKNLL